MCADSLKDSIFELLKARSWHRHVQLYRNPGRADRQGVAFAQSSQPVPLTTRFGHGRVLHLPDLGQGARQLV